MIRESLTRYVPCLEREVPRFLDAATRCDDQERAIHPYDHLR